MGWGDFLKKEGQKPRCKRETMRIYIKEEEIKCP